MAIPNEYLALVGFMTWGIIMGSIGVWAKRGVEREDRARALAERERYRKIEEDTMREIYGPAGKPKKPSAEPAAPPRSAG
jgi:hypothetical protein